MVQKDFLKNNNLVNTLFFCVAKKKATKLLSKRMQWESIQKERLAYLLNYAKSHSRYYWMHIGEQNVTPEIAVAVLKTLPLLTKDIVREQQYNIYSDETGPNWKKWGNTGGSTGEPLKFPRKSCNIWNEAVNQYFTYNYLNNLGGGIK